MHIHILLSNVIHNFLFVLSSVNGMNTHAMIFSDDAPSLENALHNEFTKGRLNMINRRKEFFYASLDEIERVVRQNFNKPVEFIRTADAAQYRESLNLRKADAP